jgi:VWFA-related protein
VSRRFLFGLLVLALCGFLASIQHSLAQRPSGSTPRPIEPGGNPTTTRNPLSLSAKGPRAEDESKVEFRSETILVQLPVVVTDKAGHHAHGLSKDDFRVFENGRERTIATFEELTTNNAPIAVATQPGIFTNQVVNRDQRRAITIIALDMVNTPFLDQSFARRELIKYLARSLDNGQTLGLVFITSKGLRVVYGLAPSAATLQEILKKASGETSAMERVDSDSELAAFAAARSDLLVGLTPTLAQAAISDFINRGDIDYAQYQQEAAIETTMQAFLSIAWSLAGVPGRKTLLWATGGFPFALDSPSAVPGGSLSLLYERAMQALNEAEISVYPVDVQGLVVGGPGASSGRTVRPQSITTRSWLQTTNKDTLKQFAEMTGGKAYYDSNDLAGAFQRATDDASSYYMIGYYLDTKNDKPGWRELKVKLEKKDLQIRARKGFLVTNATMNPETSRANDMNYAMADSFEATGLPIEMKWGEIKDSPDQKDKKRVSFLVHIIGTGISVQGASNTMNLAVTAVATKPSKKRGDAAVVAANVAQSIQGNLKPDNVATVKAHGMVYPGALELAPGQYSVRIVVRDNLSGRLGSVSAPVTVN